MRRMIDEIGYVGLYAKIGQEEYTAGENNHRIILMQLVFSKWEKAEYQKYRNECL
jgi:hypothetical protein